MEATTKTITPITHIFVWPKMSDRRPPRANSAARAIRYAFTTHWTPVDVRPSSRWMSGTAMETIV